MIQQPLLSCSCTISNGHKVAATTKSSEAMRESMCAGERAGAIPKILGVDTQKLCLDTGYGWSIGQLYTSIHQRSLIFPGMFQTFVRLLGRFQRPSDLACNRPISSGVCSGISTSNLWGPRRERYLSLGSIDRLKTLTGWIFSHMIIS